MAALCGRLILLHHLSDLFCGCLHMLDLTPPSPLGSLRGVLLSSGKEMAFKKVVQSTMVRDKHHGPVLELNRMLLKNKKFSESTAAELNFSSSSGYVHLSCHFMKKKTCFSFYAKKKIVRIWINVDSKGASKCII